MIASTPENQEVAAQQPVIVFGVETCPVDADVDDAIADHQRGTVRGSRNWHLANSLGRRNLVTVVIGMTDVRREHNPQKPRIGSGAGIAALADAIDPGDDHLAAP